MKIRTTLAVAGTLATASLLAAAPAQAYTSSPVVYTATWGGNAQWAQSTRTVTVNDNRDDNYRTRVEVSGYTSGGVYRNTYTTAADASGSVPGVNQRYVDLRENSWALIRVCKLRSDGSPFDCSSSTWQV